MLREVANVQQISTEPKRRWFFCHEQDLWVWLDEGGRVVRFQLSYGKYRNEHAIRWRLGLGFAHERVDDGESGPGMKQAPIMLRDGAFPAASVLGRFLELSRDMPQDIAAFVAERLREHPEHGAKT